jgi:intracellular sulfur oxidation DsrE/DsrF family protein
MSMHDKDAIPRRRWFLSRFGATFAVTGAALWTAGARARAQTNDHTRWQPASHSEDAWLSQIPGKHRFVFDSTTPDGFSNALTFANNYFVANQNGYGLKDGDLAVVIVARHHSTQFAYSDAIWEKYQEHLVKAAQTSPLPATRDRLDALVKRGVHLAVCQMATRRIAGTVASGTGQTADTVFQELAANLVRNGHLVPAGIVAVNRAQERGYSLAHAG